MRMIAEWWYRVRSLFARGRLEAELDEELRFHVEMETEKLVRAGVEPKEARRRALVAFGGVEYAKEGAREARGMRWVEELGRDVRLALRSMRKNPVFAGTLVLVLGVAVGANSALFAVADALMLRPLPFGEPEELVQIQQVSPESGSARRIVRWEAARRWTDEADFMEGTLPNARWSLLYLGGAEPLRLIAQAVAPNFEEILRVRPALGRGFAPEDAEPGAPVTVILSDGFWRSAFGADPEVIGRTIELDGIPHRVIGVMPAGFKYPTYSSTDLYVPLYEDGTLYGDPIRAVYLDGRLATAGLEAAQARADALATALEEREPDDRGWRMRMVPLRDAFGASHELRRAMALLGGAVALILLIAGANAVHLLLVRGWARGRELAVRRALGASRARLSRQMLTESGLLALASGIVAVVTALAALHAIQGIMPHTITFLAPHAVEVEQRTLAFTFALAAIVGAIVGAIPALRATRVDVTAARAGLTPYAATTPARGRLRRGLLVGEVALSVLLLVGAGLLVRSFVGLASVDPGFRVEDITVLTLSVPSENYPTGAERGAFLDRLDERLEALPGVEGVALGAHIPPSHLLHVGLELETESGAAPEDGMPRTLPTGLAAPDFFDVLDVDVLSGRRLTAADAGTDRVIIDTDLARFLWGEQSAVGRRFRIREDADWLTVVGVVGDLALEGPHDPAGDFEILYPYDPASPPGFVSLAIRTRGEPGPLLRAIREAVHDVDPRQPINEVAPATTLYAGTFDLPRFLLVLMSILSGLALGLTAVGIAGVLAFGVSQRRHEFGVRVALGARPAQLSRAVVREGLGVAALGTVLGAAGALGLARLIRGLLFEVGPADPRTFAAVVVVSFVAAAIACYWPARRAMQVDPVKVLKVE